MDINDFHDNIKSRIIVIDKGFIRCDVDLEKTPNTCFLSNLLVDENSRHKGLGTQLIQEAEKTAKEFGCVYMSLVAKQDDWTFEWYKRLGYIPNVEWDNEHILLTKTIYQQQDMKNKTIIPKEWEERAKEWAMKNNPECYQASIDGYLAGVKAVILAGVKAVLG